MSKKNVMLGLIAVSTLALSPMILADNAKGATAATPADPATAPAPDTTITTPDVTSMPIMPSKASNGRGFYVKGQVGYGFLKKEGVLSGDGWIKHASGTVSTIDNNYSLNDKKSRGLTGRIAVGYNLNPYFAIEVGGFIPHAMYRDFDIATTDTSANFTNNINVASGLKTNFYGADAMVKAILPLKRVYAYVGAGIAYIHAKTTESVSGYTQNNGGAKAPMSHVTIGDTTLTNGDVYSHSYIRPKIAVGLGYNVTNNIAVDVEYSRIVGAGKLGHVGAETTTDTAPGTKTGGRHVDGINPSYLPSINSIMFGVTYKFNM